MLCQLLIALRAWSLSGKAWYGTGLTARSAKLERGGAQVADLKRPGESSQLTARI
jgi:hypothetical protein